MDEEKDPIASTEDEAVAADPEFACAGCRWGCEGAPVGGPDQVVASQVLVKFDRTRKVGFFTHGQLELKPGDHVVVETERGTGTGRIVSPPQRMLAGKRGLRRVLKRVEADEETARPADVERERQAFGLCLERINSRRLPMKLVGVEYVLGDPKAVFYFCAEGRIDFRDLVRDLARELHVRIEMRQIGIRDQSKMVGGIGTCGRELCCSTFLRGFDPVTIKMAKVQGLVLNPQKVSGQCGRLMCCLAYEQEQYKEARKGLPKVGAFVMTPSGEGRVRELDVLGRRARVQLEGQPITTFDVDQLQPALPPPLEGARPRPGRPEGEPTEPVAVEEQGAPREPGAEGAGRRRRGRGGKSGEGERPRPEGERPRGDAGPRDEGSSPSEDFDELPGDETFDAGFDDDTPPTRAWAELAKAVEPVAAESLDDSDEGPDEEGAAPGERTDEEGRRPRRSGRRGGRRGRGRGGARPGPGGGTPPGPGTAPASE